MPTDPLLARIQENCRLSTSAGGAMPIVMRVRDEAEKARALQLLRGRKGNAAITVKVEGER